MHIDGDDYWDGGIVSNTPLQYVLDLHPRSEPLVVLQVDLFNARGEMPHTLSGVMERQKDITYSSRTRMNTDALAANMNLQQAIADLIEKLPPHLRRDPAVEAVQAELTHHPIDIFHLIYRDKPYELESKDYEFSRAAVEEHWESGARDMRRVLAHRDLAQRRRGQRCHHLRPRRGRQRPREAARSVTLTRRIALTIQPRLRNRHETGCRIQDASKEECREH